MKPITLCKSLVNDTFYYGKWDGSIGTKNLDEDDFLNEIDNAISNGYFITITNDSLATAIHKHCKHGDNVFDGYQDPDLFDSATTIQSIGEILDKTKEISDRNISDEVCDMNTVDYPCITSMADAMEFNAIVDLFCARKHLRKEEYVSQQDVINLIGE